MSIRRVRVAWSGTLVQGGGLSTFWFDDATGTSQQCVNAVSTFLASVDTDISTALTWATEADVAILNLATGIIEGFDQTSVQTGGGNSAGEALPPATQALCRMRTSTVVGGRLLRGRLFLPGYTETGNTNFSPSSAVISQVNSAASILIADANSDWRVWSRVHGASATITAATCWNKWASLRSRRD